MMFDKGRLIVGKFLIAKSLSTFLALVATLYLLYYYNNELLVEIFYSMAFGTVIATVVSMGLTYQILENTSPFISKKQKNKLNLILLVIFVINLMVFTNLVIGNYTFYTMSLIASCVLISFTSSIIEAI